MEKCETYLASPAAFHSNFRWRMFCTLTIKKGNRKSVESPMLSIQEGTARTPWCTRNAPLERAPLFRYTNGTATTVPPPTVPPLCAENSRNPSMASALTEFSAKVSEGYLFCALTEWCASHQRILAWRAAFAPASVTCRLSGYGLCRLRLQA